MRKKSVVAALLALSITCATHAQNTIYVKAGPGGGISDGTSWATAFVSLDAALATGAPGQQIWVAAGVYRPIDPANGFIMPVGVQLYGGFDGTETQLDQRNPALNPTILDGDLLGNDTPGNLGVNRSDNAVHVLQTLPGSNPLEQGVVDGFVIQNGHTLTASGSPDLTLRGGGILALASLKVSNCLFRYNRAASGGGIAALAPGGHGLEVINCAFEQNEATNQSAGVFMRNLNSGVIQNSLFRNNTTNRGCVYPVNGENILVEDCLFENNNAGTNFGAGFFAFQSSYTLRNCIFKNNMAASAAGAYHDGREGGDFARIYDCTFDGNTATNFGAGFYSWQGDYEMKRCTFINNTANNAAGIYNDGREFDSQFSIDSCHFENNKALSYGGTGLYAWKSRYTLSNCTFVKNEAASTAAGIYNSDSTQFVVRKSRFFDGFSRFGAGMANYGAACAGQIDSCLFENNVVVTSGGALTVGFGANVTIRNSDFRTNNARFGGAVFCQNDYTTLKVEKSEFSGNSAEVRGGALTVSAGVDVRTDNSLFIANVANNGGAINMLEDSLDLTKLTAHRCIFESNIANNQGGAIDLSDTDTELVNCLFSFNQNFGAGAGGAIINNAADSSASPLRVVNCTFGENISILGAGIAQWQGGAGQATLFLQNSAFQNTGFDNYAVEGGTPVVQSLGGNVSSDASFGAALNGPGDLSGTDPKFVSPDDLDFKLLPGSPCIDRGVSDGAPSVDLNGAARQGAPDAGCYEFISIGTKAPVIALPLLLSPTPATTSAILSVEHEAAGKMVLQALDAQGRVVWNVQAFKPAGPWTYELPVAQWPAGYYYVRAVLPGLHFSGTLIKQ